MPRVRATTSKSVHAREIALPVEVVKELDHYIFDVRQGEQDDDAPVFTNRYGNALTGTAIRVSSTGSRSVLGFQTSARTCSATHGPRTTTAARMVDRYCKVRPLDERRRAPSPFTAPRAARLGVEKRPSEKRPSPQKSAPARRRLATIPA